MKTFHVVKKIGKTFPLLITHDKKDAEDFARRKNAKDKGYVVFPWTEDHLRRMEETYNKAASAYLTAAEDIALALREAYDDAEEK